MTSECTWAPGSLTLDDAFGSFAGYNLGIGKGNTLMGYESGYDMTSGINNSCYGIGSGSHLSTGSDNTCLGYFAGGGGTYPLTTDRWQRARTLQRPVAHFESLGAYRHGVKKLLCVVKVGPSQNLQRLVNVEQRVEVSLLLNSQGSDHGKAPANCHLTADRVVAQQSRA